MSGLREHKKQRTRAHIADVAARLFAEHGYERVSMAQIARIAEVSEQTVFNYFPTKARLLLDLDESLRANLKAAIVDRSPGTSVPVAIGDIALSLATPDPDTTEEELRGGLGVIAAKSPEVHRLVLEATEGYAESIASALIETERLDPAVARVRSVALAALLSTVTAEFGRRMLAGERLSSITAAITSTLRTQVEDLERWWSAD